MTSPPIVSVLMTVYNGVPFLADAINSVLAQTFNDFELVIIENGSTDATPEILKTFDDQRIQVFAIEHTGRTEALNIGLNKTRGKYVAVLDADDIAMPERLALEVEYLDASPQTTLIASWIEQINEAGEIIKSFQFKTDSRQLKTSFAYENTVTHSSAMYVREMALAIGGYPGQYVYAQDFALYQELALRGDVAMVPQPLVQLRVHGASATQSGDYNFHQIIDKLHLHSLAAKRFGAVGDALRRSKAVCHDLEINAGFARLDEGRIISGLGWLVRGFVRGPIGFLRHSMVQQRIIAPVPGLLVVVRGVGRLLGINKAR